MKSARRSTRRVCFLAVFILAFPEAFSQAPSGWIQNTSWLFLGPLGNHGGCDPAGFFSEDWIAPGRISEVFPSDGEPQQIDFAAAASDSWLGAGDRPAWICVESLGLPVDDLVDLEEIVFALSAVSGDWIPTTDIFAVLVTYVTLRSTEPLPVRLCSSSDDSIQIWVNDRRVQQVRSCRGTASGCSEKAGALLVPGTNAIKVLLWQGTGEWSFRLRIERLDGGPITSEQGDLEFGCREPGPIALDGLRVERRIRNDFPDCAVPEGAVEVEIRGSSGQRPEAAITENLSFSTSGAIAIDSITAGGVFTAAGAPPGGPVGMFDGAADIGSPCGAGSTVMDADGSYTVTGSGLDIWLDGDQFQYAYQRLRGNFTMTARVAGRAWAPGTRWGKAGIMARQSFSGSSRYAMIQTHGEDQTDADRFAARGTHGGNDNFEETELFPGDHRDWMRLTRMGSIFTGFFSLDGTVWEREGSLDWGPDAPAVVLVGLAVSSRGGCETASITFDKVTIAGGVRDPGPLPPDGGTIVWKKVPRAALQAGIGYALRGRGRAAFLGNDGEHALEGPSSADLRDLSPAGIFSSAQDIGQPCAEGSTSFDRSMETYTVAAGGKDIGSSGDQFQFAYSRVSGDFSLRARLKSRDWLWGRGKAGLMARETCDEDSRFFLLHDSPEPGDTRCAVRRAAGTSSILEYGHGGHPDWLRLDRVGDLLAGSISADGINWVLRYAETWVPPLPSTALAGLAFTSQGGCARAGAVFDRVTLIPIDYTVTRRMGSGASGCPAPGEGNPLAVELRGKGPAGPDVLVREEVHGQLEVKDISDGGVFQPFPHPPRRPVGMWADALDIGEPCFAGSTADGGDGSYTLTGGGVDIWKYGDQFQFAYLEASGDFRITVRIAEKNWAPGTRWGKAGLMARQSLDPSSRYCGVQDHGRDLQDPTRWSARPTHAGSDNYETVSLPPSQHHGWLHLERQGDLFIGSSSLDGTSWIEQGRQLWSSAPRTVLLGLEVCSGGDCNPATIRFDSIDYRGGGGTPGLVPDGGSIAWNVSREALGRGIGYSVRSEGNGYAAFSGAAGGFPVAGGPSFSVTGAQALQGELVLAHDVGSPCVPGSTVFDPAAGRYTVTGGGKDIWMDGDQFHFVYREVAGDSFIAVARIADRRWAPGSRWGKAGIMVREDCTPRSRYAMIQDHGADLQDQDRFAGRPTRDGDDNFELSALPPGAHRDWLRLERSGSVFTGFLSDDGSAWEREGSIDLGPGAPPAVLLGLAVSSHADCAASTIVFDELKVQVGRNHPPVACIESDPSPPLVRLEGGTGEIVLRGICSGDGDGGAQGLAFHWSLAGGPAAVAIENKDEAVTRVAFTRAGTYLLELEVNDGQIADSSASVTLEVTVTDRPEPRFRRGDSDGNGAPEITDVIFFLSFQYMGGSPPACFDAADTDDSGALEITDAIYFLSWQFLGGPAPLSPGPWECGPDVNRDPFPECDYRSCSPPRAFTPGR